jgi:uncharacterized protein (TIGR02757 family)
MKKSHRQPAPPLEGLRPVLEDLYTRYNRREFVHPDPLEFLYAYPDLRDREVVGLVAATLAVGRVAHILRSVGCVLGRLTEHPARFLEGISAATLEKLLADCRHRFLSGPELAAMLWGARRIQKKWSTLGACFAEKMKEEDKTRGSRPASKPWHVKEDREEEEAETVVPALGAFVQELTGGQSACGRLLCHPDAGSACKRLNLYLRWMVRRDDVDPGGWTGVSPSRLVVPLDVHMHRIGRTLGLTSSRYANLRTAIEITRAFRQMAPDDPVRYDFALTRLGIRTDTDEEEFLRGCGAALSG